MAEGEGLQSVLTEEHASHSLLVSPIPNPRVFAGSVGSFESLGGSDRAEESVDQKSWRKGIAPRTHS